MYFCLFLFNSERKHSSPEPVDDLPTYADPHEIKREEFPGTEDMYTMPDKKKKTHKPKDHLPTYADPSAIEHETAPATGNLYTVVDKPKRSFRKQPPPPPEGALQTYAEVDVGKKQRGRKVSPHTLILILCPVFLAVDVHTSCPPYYRGRIWLYSPIHLCHSPPSSCPSLIFL